MRRNNTVRTIIIVVTILWSIYQLYPTYHVSQLKKKSSVYVSEIAELTRMSIDDINDALTRGLLERQIRDSLSAAGADKLAGALDKAEQLIQLNDKVAKYEVRAIKQGLDLQGGSYLVYEVDLPKLARDLARPESVDQQFEKLMQEVETEASQPNVDFFDALQERFAAAQVRISKYFGTRAQTDAQIISELKKTAEDAVNRNLEILRNRIDQFGVSEPSITKQGDRRIVVELAGITDVGRAKNIIGKTALLEFKLVKEPDEVNDVFTKINNFMKRDLATQRGQEVTADTTASEDTTAVASKTRSDEEVSVDDIFGGSSLLGASEADSTNEDSLLVDQEIFDESPFFSLLGALGNDFAVPAKNVRAVERILNDPRVAELIPDDAQFVWASKPDPVADKLYFRLYLVKKDAELTGTYLTDARATIGSGAGVTRQGEWQVNFQMNSEGGRIFSRVTGANVDKRLAIILDNKVVMAPNIDERIPHGSGVIRGNMGSEEAQDLAIVLRAGALQAPMHVIEERTVGPTLGRDSIAKGQYSTLIGFTLVVIFMVIYYKVSGLIANVALILNILLVMAALALFKATLTLPGVAGIILTIGMAVDANVLIFERIREELRSGKTVRAAIDAGYSRAFRTILDANLTTLLTALVLYQFGTGPIRGFAVTLSIGIVASMFTAIVVTRVIFDTITSRRRMATLSI